jgi:fructokinase
MGKKAVVLCFGEVLWDCLPRGLFLGGAPVNVAYHLNRHGLEAIPVTCVGRDFLGNEILRRLDQFGVRTKLVQTHKSLPTGAAIASINKQGNASYEILENVAWDEIYIPESIKPVAAEAQAVIFGSLAMRTAYNRESLQALLAQAHNAERVFDVNLRPPFDNLARVNTLAQRASLLKLNHEEAARLSGGSADRYEENARILADATGAPMVCITCGAEGAGLLRGKDWFWEPARAVEVADTVGVGDSFLASLVQHLIIEREPPEVSLQKACRVGEFIASQEGATPNYQVSNINN